MQTRDTINNHKSHFSSGILMLLVHILLTITEAARVRIRYGNNGICNSWKFETTHQKCDRTIMQDFQMSSLADVRTCNSSITVHMVHSIKPRQDGIVCLFVSLIVALLILSLSRLFCRNVGNSWHK